MGGGGGLTADDTIVAGGRPGLDSGPTDLQRRPPPLTPVRAELVLWAIPIVVTAVMGFSMRWTFDDGFIYFRTVDQILAGNGAVFNATARVETFTSPLWMAVLTVGEAVSPLRLEYTAVVLSVTATVAGMMLATGGAARLAWLHSPGALRVPLGSMLLASLWPVWVWTTGGLEIGLTYAWLGACWLLLIRCASTAVPGRASTGTLIVLGLGWLVRPELVLSSCLFVGLAVVTAPTSSTRTRLRMLLTATAIPVAYQVFRMGYYGVAVSTPAIAKEGTVLRPGYGWDYLVNFVGPYLLVIPVLAILLVVGRSTVRRLWVASPRAVVAAGIMSASGVLHAASIVLIGGDYVHARLLLPALFALLAPFFVASATRDHVEALVITGLWALLATLVLRPPADTATTLFVRGHLGTSLTYQDRGFASRGIEQPWIDGPGLYVVDPFVADGRRAGIDLVDPAMVLAASRAIGVNAYALGPDVPVVDLHGLADPLTAHQGLAGRLLPGHEKLAGAAWIAAMHARDPAAVLPEDLPGYGVDLAAAPSDLQFLIDVAWAQAALECGPVEQRFAAMTEPLTIRRFLANIVDAPSNTALRIDADPAVAYRELCGDDLPPPVVALLERARVSTTLPARHQRGQIVIAGECEAVFVATGLAEEPWRFVEAPGHNVLLGLDATEDRPRRFELFRLGPYGSDTAAISVETDGEGNYRVRQDLDWFPPALQPWTPIPEDGFVGVNVSADREQAAWSLSVAGTRLAGLPLTAETDGVATVILPVATEARPPGGVAAAFIPVEPSPACVTVLHDRD